METLFQKGGPVMYALAVCSVISLTIVLERIWFWIKEALWRDRSALEEVFTRIHKGDFEGAAGIGESVKDPVITIILSGVAHREYSTENALDIAVAEYLRRMERGLSLLDTIITVAPLLGILGTVLGIISSFDLLGSAGIEDPSAVTTGIAQALLTTAGGLIIAIGTLVPYNFFNRFIEKRMAFIEKQAARLLLLQDRFAKTHLSC